jgi:translation initiation factor 2 gamma subunit (eIF-2gamma)
LNRKDIQNLPIKEWEILLINVAHTTNACTVIEAKKDRVYVKLKKPIVYLKNQRIAIQRRFGHRWRVSAIGKIE